MDGQCQATRDTWRYDIAIYGLPWGAFPSLRPEYNSRYGISLCQLIAACFYDGNVFFANDATPRRSSVGA